MNAPRQPRQERLLRKLRFKVIGGITREIGGSEELDHVLVQACELP